MLTESVSDPRRANWLTLSSMSEDFCWPEENGTSRPNWELEAEILRLTTRLMMRERELRQVKNQLKTQSSKNQQQVANWRRRMEEKEEQMKEVLVQKDADMQNIVSQLMLFEAELRREQVRIEDLLTEKEAQILLQQKEIERLKRSVDTRVHTAKDFVTLDRAEHPQIKDTCSPAQSSAVSRSDDEKFDVGDLRPSPTDSETLPSSAIGDFDAIECSKRSASAESDFSSVIDALSTETSKQIANCDSTGDLVNMECSKNETNAKTDSSAVNEDVDRSRCSKGHATSTAINFTPIKSSPLRISDFNMLQNIKRSLDVRTNSSLSDSVQLHKRGSLPSSLKGGYNKNGEFSRLQNVYIFEDSLPYASQLSVRKFKDSSLKIRAIHDVTNVQSLDANNDGFLNERKRIPIKSPQKMKDLKAKRVNPHRMPRPVMAEMTAQAIL